MGDTLRVPLPEAQLPEVPLPEAPLPVVAMGSSWLHVV
jgi:hypothetical protein